MLILEKKLKVRMKMAAKKLGLDEREIVNRAVSAYLLELEDWRSLKEELRFWEVLSAETMRKYKF